MSVVPRSFAAELVHRLDGASLAVDTQLKVHATNAYAEELAAQSALLSISPLGTVILANRTDQDSLRSAVSGTLTSRTARLQSFYVTDPDAPPGREARILVAVEAIASYGSDRQAAELAIVSLRCGPIAPAISAEMIRSCFPLTRAEAEVAQALLDGDSVDAIARKRRTKPLTIRNQRQSIYNKVGVDSESRLVMKLSACWPRLLPPRHKPVDDRPA